MALTVAAPTTGTKATPTCCGQAMRPKESFVTQRSFHQCTKCLRNDYSVNASTHAHTVHAH